MRCLKGMKILFLAACCVLWCGASVSASGLQDTTEQAEPYVTVTDGWISKKKVKSGDTLKYRFTIHDNGILAHNEGWDFACPGENGKIIPDDLYVEARWEGPGKQVIEREYKWKRVKRKKGKWIGLKSDSFTVSDQIKVLDGMEPGEWKLADLYISGIPRDDPEDESEIINLLLKDDFDDADDCPADISAFGSFRVKKKKGAKVDHKAPKVDLQSMKLSKTALKPDEKSVFTVKIKDQSQIEAVKCTFAEHYPEETGWDRYLQDYKMTYDRKKKCWKCTVTMSSSPEKMVCSCIWVKDIYGNVEYYLGYELKIDKDGNLQDWYKKPYSNMVIYRK